MRGRRTAHRSSCTLHDKGERWTTRRYWRYGKKGDQSTVEHGTGHETSPHPFAHREILQRKILGILKSEEEEVEDGIEPIELTLVDVGSVTGTR